MCKSMQRVPGTEVGEGGSEVGRVRSAREVQGRPHGGGGTQAESSKDVHVCPPQTGRPSIPENGAE